MTENMRTRIESVKGHPEEAGYLQSLKFAQIGLIYGCQKAKQAVMIYAENEPKCIDILVKLVAQEEETLALIDEAIKAVKEKKK